MVSFLKKLFTSSGAESSAKIERGEAVEHKGFRIQPAPEAEGGQWRVAGYIIDGAEEGSKELKFIRADLFSSQEEASAVAIRKGRQIIDEQGPRLFPDSQS